MVKFLAEQKADPMSRLYGLGDLGYEDDMTLLMAALETRQSPEMIRTLLEAFLSESIESLFPGSENNNIHLFGPPCFWRRACFSTHSIFKYFQVFAIPS